MTDQEKSLAFRQYDTNTEIDLRAEMDTFLHGSITEPVRGQWGLVWIADPTKRAAGYKRKADHYPEVAPSDEYLESGFIHSEHKKRIWVGFTGGSQKVYPMGRINPMTTFIYLEHDVFNSIRVAELSEVWTLVLDEDGEPIRENSEYVKDVRWNIRQAYPFREQGARIEYWRCHCERQNV